MVKKTAMGVNYIMQREDTLSKAIVVKNGPPVNEDLFIMKENNLLFILRVMKTFHVQERK